MRSVSITSTPFTHIFGRVITGGDLNARMSTRPKWAELYFAATLTLSHELPSVLHSLRLDAVVNAEHAVAKRMGHGSD